VGCEKNLGLVIIVHDGDPGSSVASGNTLRGKDGSDDKIQEVTSWICINSEVT
jgi:hypothetical protein